MFVDLVTAVAIGLIAAGIAASRQFERLELDSVVSVPLLDQSFLPPEATDPDDPFSARAGLVALRGSFTVASSGKLINTIGVDIAEHEVVILDFTNPSSWTTARRWWWSKWSKWPATRTPNALSWAWTASRQSS